MFPDASIWFWLIAIATLILIIGCILGSSNGPISLGPRERESPPLPQRSHSPRRRREPLHAQRPAVDQQYSSLPAGMHNSVTNGGPAPVLDSPPAMPLPPAPTPVVSLAMVAEAITQQPAPAMEQSAPLVIQPEIIQAEHFAATAPPTAHSANESPPADSTASQTRATKQTATLSRLLNKAISERR